MRPEKGDVVKLRSGGPKMTVMSWQENIRVEPPTSLTTTCTNSATRTYLCQWFSNNCDLRSDNFSEAVLKLHRNKKDKKK